LTLGPAESRPEKSYASSTIKCNTGKHKKKRENNVYHECREEEENTTSKSVLF